MVAVVGFPERAEDVYNAAAVLADGAVHAIYRKVYLPNYGVFDEQRYFQAGQVGAVIDLDGHRLGLTVCEDIWEPGPPASEEALAGATLILNISASPYHAGKGSERERMFAQRARDNLACIAFCGLVGGQDELVFDGHSCVIDHTGETIARAAQFQEELLVCDVDLDAAAAARLRDPSQRPAARRAERRAALLPPLISSRSHQASAQAPAQSVPIGRAGRAARAGGGRGLRRADARAARLRPQERLRARRARSLGRDRLRARRLPGRRRARPRARQRRDHALALLLRLDPGGRARARRRARAAHPRAADRGGHARLRARPATPSSPRAQPDLTEENLQARIRGNLLMALSNKFGWLVLTTGNKSEMSVGYTTLYGDLAGGFAVIKDVPKTLVYRLCAWRNSPAGATAAHALAGAGEALERPIPASIIERAPSAELGPTSATRTRCPPTSCSTGSSRATSSSTRAASS